MADFMTSLLMS